MIKTLFKKGLFHIVGSNFINKIIAFLTNIALVRILTKEEFGLFTSSFNVFWIIFLFSGLGLTNGMLYYCSQKRSEDSKANYYHYCYKFGNLINLGLSILLCLYGILIPFGIQEARPYIVMISAMPLVAYWYDYYSIVLRTQKENKKYSLLLNVNSILYAVFAITGSLVAGITGTIIGRYLAYILSAIMGYYFSRPFINPNKVTYKPFEREEVKSLYGYSVKAGLTSALNNILYLIDVYIIGIVIVNASVLASYKVGAQLPENMNFIPQSLMVFFLPIIIEHQNEKSWLKDKVKDLYLAMAGISLVISALLILLAPYIVKLLWGSQYLDAVPCFRILTLSFFFLSTFRLTSTNVLLSLGRPGYTLMVSVIAGIANIILDVTLTMAYGSIGAAYGTLLVTIIASLLSFPYVIYVIKNKEESVTV